MCLLSSNNEFILKTIQYSWNEKLNDLSNYTNLDHTEEDYTVFLKWNIFHLYNNTIIQYNHVNKKSKDLSNNTNPWNDHRIFLIINTLSWRLYSIPEMKYFSLNNLFFIFSFYFSLNNLISSRESNDLSNNTNPWNNHRIYYN